MMVDIRIGSSPLGARSKTASVAVVALGTALFLVDFVVLRGEPVAHADVYLDSGEPTRITVDRVGEQHLVEISTRRRVHRETRGRKLKLRLEDPDGELVYETSELADRKTRYFRFTPTAAGEYTLHIEDNGLLMKSTRGSARVEVLVGDRRILASLFSAIPF